MLISLTIPLGVKWKIIVNFQSRIESLITHLVIWTLKIQYEQSRTRVVTVTVQYLGDKK